VRRSAAFDRDSRAWALNIGCPLVATAIAELARNIVLYAERGEIVLKPLDDGAVAVCW
jgi:anti-sigma regulatory factor (Ser/Thr protein kinase)